ncbi:MAG: FAD-dependent oxidoreductase [Planctomycetota bacterium]|nr:FAD-dependent oxidoreductase [Planctomycetota bacterium]
MKTQEFDVVVLGSGFAGSLTAMILQRVGRRVALIDRTRHPRFAIGESSTPIANMVLRDLAKRYDLPRLVPLTKYGTWQQAYPHIGCGLKRGFSYFAHEAGRTFAPSLTHANELLVAASSHDRDSDTQWLRADVDQFFCAEAATFGVTLLEDCAVREIQHDRVGDWSIDCQHEGRSLPLRAAFVIDATGEAGVLPHSLGIESCGEACQTHSRAIFSHFRGVGSWHERLNDLGGNTQDHPFHCDNAAQHHILDGAWLWMLRFNDGLTSAGLVLDEAKHPLDQSLDAAAEWHQWIERYPSVAAMFADADFSPVPGELIRTKRLQRRWAQLAGEDWALLPHTAGFVDPLHSTGIAHSLCGVEHLCRILDREWRAETRLDSLRGYGDVVAKEFDLIDELVASCFACFGQFDLLVVASMLYFAAATTYERLRCGGEASIAFLGADRKEIRDLLHTACKEVSRQASTPGPVDINQFRCDVASLIAPINHVGLLDTTLANMYRHTAAPM